MAKWYGAGSGIQRIRNDMEVLINAGKIQKNLESDEDFKTPLQQKLDEFGQQLSKV